MYKINKAVSYKTAIVVSYFFLGLKGCCNTEIPEKTLTSNEIELETTVENNDKVIQGQNIDGCIVYKIVTRTRTINPETGGYSPWQNEISEEFYIGSSTETYNEPININKTKQIEKVKMGYIDNSYTMSDFYVETRTYYEEAYVDGEWIRTGNEFIIDNKEFSVPKRCMSRCILDYESITKEQRIPKTSPNKLMRIYEVTIKDGDYQFQPTFIFTTFTNLPNTGMKVQEAGEYYISEELEYETNKRLMKTKANA